MEKQKRNFNTKIAIALYIMLAVVFLSGCIEPPQYVHLLKDKPYLIIEKSELGKAEKFGRYRYTAKDYSGDIVFYLDEKLNVGDTVWIGKNYH